MEKPKQLLHWINSMLEEKMVSDFCWIDRDKKIFQMPWPHASSSMWQKEHSKLFILWANHKDKLKGREGDYKRLKATFRCALNSRRELRELKNQRTKYHRVWQIILPSSNSGTETTVPKITSSEVKRRAKTKLSCKVSKEKRIREIKMKISSASESSPERSSSFSSSDSNSEMHADVNYEDPSYLPSFSSLLRYQPKISFQETSDSMPQKSEEFIDNDLHSFHSYNASYHQVSPSIHRKEHDTLRSSIENEFQLPYDYEISVPSDTEYFADYEISEPSNTGYSRDYEISNTLSPVSDVALLHEAYSSIFHPNTNPTPILPVENNEQSQQNDIDDFSLCSQKTDLMILH